MNAVEMARVARFMTTELKGAAMVYTCYVIEEYGPDYFAADAHILCGCASDGARCVFVCVSKTQDERHAAH